jgi:hypothetical protein
MGRWSEEIFGGDYDLDEASDISQDAGIELYHYELEDDNTEDKIGGKGLEATRAHLNNGVLNGLFKKYTEEPMPLGDKKLRLIFLGE